MNNLTNMSLLNLLESNYENPNIIIDSNTINQINDNYLLKYTLIHKKYTLSKYLFNLHQVDKYQIDDGGNNLAHLVCLNRFPYLINRLIKEIPSLFYEKNNDSKSAIDILLNSNTYNGLIPTNQELIKECIFIILQSHYKKLQIISDDSLNIINNSPFLKTVLIEAQYNDLNQLNTSHKNQLKKTKKI